MGPSWDLPADAKARIAGQVNSGHVDTAESLGPSEEKPTGRRASSLI